MVIWPEKLAKKLARKVGQLARKLASRLNPSTMAAEAEAAASLRELAATLMASGTAPKLQTLQFLGDLGLDDEEDALEADVISAVASALEEADGPAGDRTKYEYAVGSMMRRWELFLALYNLGVQEPTHEMVKLFVGFMYKFRQRSSKTGRQGLGDSMAEMAQYILAQVRGRGSGARGAGASATGQWNWLA